jgi:hypothetical protein
MIKILVTPLQPRAGTADVPGGTPGTTPGTGMLPFVSRPNRRLAERRLNFELQPLPSGWSLNDYSERVGGGLQIFFC